MEKEQLITSGKCGDNLTWRFEQDTLYIEGSGAMYDSHWSVNTRDWEDIKTNIKRIVIQEACTYIGEYVFCGCTNLMDVSIPDSVECIGYYAFGNCGNIQSVLVPDAFIRLTGDAGDYDCYMHPLLDRERFIVNVFRGVLIVNETTFIDSWDKVTLNIQVRKKKESSKVEGFRPIYYVSRKTGDVSRYFVCMDGFDKKWDSDWAPDEDLIEISEKEAIGIWNKLLLQKIDSIRLKELIWLFKEIETDWNCLHHRMFDTMRLVGWEPYYGMYIGDWDEEKIVPKEMTAWQIRIWISRYWAELDGPWRIRESLSLSTQSTILEMLLRLAELLSRGSA